MTSNLTTRRDSIPPVRLASIGAGCIGEVQLSKLKSRVFGEEITGVFDIDRQHAHNIVAAVMKSLAAGGPVRVEAPA